MKKTFHIIGALTICATMICLTSCGSNKNAEKGENNETAKADTTAKAEAIVIRDTSNVILAPAGSIVYIDMTRIQAEYQMAIDLGAEVEKKLNEMGKKTKSIKSELKRKQDKFTSAANEFQEKYSKGLYTQSTAEVKAQELQKMETEYNECVKELQKEEDKYLNTANEELFVMNNTINDAITTFIQKYNAEKGYAMILISQGDVPGDGATTLGNPVLTANPSLDITSDVLAGLNAEYNASK